MPTQKKIESIEDSVKVADTSRSKEDMPNIVVVLLEVVDPTDINFFKDFAIRSRTSMNWRQITPPVI